MEIEGIKVAVVGAGAMGGLFGALLAEAGPEVWLIDTWGEHVKAIEREGLQVERDGETRVVKLNATTEPEAVGKVDLVVIFVKSIHTLSAAKTASGLVDEDGMILTLQNGMGNVEAISEVIQPERIIAGTTSHGATLLGLGRIRHAGSGPTSIGSWVRGEDFKAQKVAGILNTAGIETKVVEDVQEILWKKLLVNVGINAITALTGIKNGELLNLEITRNLCASAVEEAAAVARADGIRIDKDVLEIVFQVARDTGSNRSSMGQDVDNKRTTEIRAINGFVVQKGRALGVETPVNQTLWSLVETLQGNY